MELCVDYLQSDPKTGILRYRRVFPARLRPFIAATSGKSRGELKVSLGSRSITDPGVMERYQAAHSRFEQLYAHAQKAAEGTYDTLDAPLTAYLVEKYRVEAMQEDAQARWDPGVKARGEMVTAAALKAGFTFPEHRPASCWTQGYRVAINAALEAYRAFAADGDVESIMDAWSGPAASLAASHGHFVDQGSAAFRELCIKLNEAAISVHEAELQRMDGQLVPTPALPVMPERQKASTVQASGKTFDEIIRAHIDNARHGIAETTKEHVRGALRFFKEAHGPLRPAEVTKEKVKEWLDLLALKPARPPGSASKLPIRELVARYGDSDLPKLNPKTLESYCGALSARWKEVEVEGQELDGLANPFSGRKFPKLAGEARGPKGFTAEELKAYLSFPTFQEGLRPVRGKGEAVYWIPLLLLLTGARPEEVAQLLVSDIYQQTEGGRWYIRFTDGGVHPVKGVQTLKTEKHGTGRRFFPVPQPLLDLGLLDYLEHLKEAGEAALFPLLRLKGKRRTIFPSFGEWFALYVYEQGVLEEGMKREPSRELRHTWTTAARASGIPREARKYIQGHGTSDDGSSNEVYGDRSPLGERIADLRFPVDVVALVPRWKKPA